MMVAFRKGTSPPKLRPLSSTNASSFASVKELRHFSDLLPTGFGLSTPETKFTGQQQRDRLAKVQSHVHGKPRLVHLTQDACARTFFHKNLGACRRRTPTAWAELAMPDHGVSSRYARIRRDPWRSPSALSGEKKKGRRPQRPSGSFGATATPSPCRRRSYWRRRSAGSVCPAPRRASPGAEKKKKESWEGSLAARTRVQT